MHSPAKTFVLLLLICLTLMGTADAQADTTRARIDIINPFVIEIDPMQRLLLINFEKDPDSLYIGFEPRYLPIL